MKRSLIFLFALIITMSSSFGQDEDCHSEYDARNFLETVKAQKCKSEKKIDDRCDCLQQLRSKNDLAEYAFASKGDVDEKVINTRVANTGRFMDVYAQATLESKAQMTILKLNDESETTPVGCPANIISGHVKRAMKEAGKTEGDNLIALYNLVKKQDSDCQSASKLNFLKKSVTECKKIHDKLKEIDDQIFKLYDSPEVSCQASLSLLVSTDGIERLRNIAKVSYVNNRLHKGNKNDSDFLSNLLKEFEKSKSFSSEGLKKIFTNLKNSKSGSEQDPCANFLEFYKKQVSENINSEEIAKAGNTAFDDKCKDDMLCQSFAITQKDMLNKIQEKFRPDPKDCVTFAEFKTYDSMPGPDLLEAFSNRNDKNASDLLSVPEKVKTDLQQQQVQFLRSNPLIAKIITAEGSSVVRDELGKAFKVLAGNMKSANSEKEKLGVYLDFMQNKVKNILDDHKDVISNSNAALCKTLGDNFAAIQMSQGIDIDEAKDYDSSDETFLSSINYCKIIQHNKVVTTNLAATLKTSPFFTLAAKSVSEREADDKDKFKTLKKHICGENNELFKAGISSCTNPDKEICRQNFISSTPFSSLMGAKGGSRILTALDKNAMATMTAQVDPAKQVPGFHEKWYRDVGSKTSKNPLATLGKEKEFRDNKINDSKIVESSTIPLRSYSPEEISSPTATPMMVPQVAAAQAASSTVNPGQEQPSFITPTQAPSTVSPQAPVAPVFDSRVVEQAKNVRDVIPQYDQKTPEEKSVSLANLKDYVRKSPDKAKLEEALDLTKEEEKVSQEIAQTKAKSNDIVNPATKAQAPSVTPTFSETSNVAGMYPMLAPAFISSGSVAASAKVYAKDPNGYGSVNDVLNKLNDQKNGTQNGRSVASVSDSPQILIQSTVADASAMARPYLIADKNEITADDSKTYKELKTDPDKLAKFLASKISISGLKEFDVISIKDPTPGSEAHMLFKVTKGKNNTLLFESWPETAKAYRISSLENLKLNLAPARP